MTQNCTLLGETLRDTRAGRREAGRPQVDDLGNPRVDRGRLARKKIALQDFDEEEQTAPRTDLYSHVTTLSIFSLKSRADRILVSFLDALLFDSRTN